MTNRYAMHPTFSVVADTPEQASEILADVLKEATTFDGFVVAWSLAGVAETMTVEAKVSDAETEMWRRWLAGEDETDA